jgi:hypothetical protein
MVEVVVKKLLAVFAIVAVMVCAPLHAFAQDDLVFGGDVYTGGSGAKPISAQRDAFAYGVSVNLSGPVGKDAHAAGFDVEVDSNVGADLYVAGGSISVRGRVGEDLSASGFMVRLNKEANIGSNARIVGANMTIDAPIGGSLLVAGGKIMLNAPVTGDVRLTASEVEFGPSASIQGTLTYAAGNKVDIPASVISSDRVRQLPFKGPDLLNDLRKTMDKDIPSFWPSFFGVVVTFLVTLGFLLIVAAVCLSFLPVTVEKLRARAVETPGLAELFGFFGLALMAGLVPASALTLVGLPLIPIVLLAIFVLWLLGYLLGAYAVSTRIWMAFSKNVYLDQSMPRKVIVLAAGLVALAVLNFIPIIGWLINLAVVFLGLGSIALLLMERALVGREGG